MSQNPFSEPEDPPEDNDRTVIRPRPGGRRMAAPPPRTASPPVDDDLPAAVENAPGPPLLAAAAPLLQLLARLRNAARQPDAGDLQQRAMQALREFERRAQESGVPAEQIRPASYTLCASIDDAVLNTPWGAASAWRRRSLTGALHPDVVGEGRFFDALERLKRDPQRYLPVIELMYLCLSLGYRGQFRQSSQGGAEAERVRASLADWIVGQRGAGPAELSTHWQGVAAPYRPARAAFPVWVAFAAAFAVWGGLFVWVSTTLNAASDSVYARMLADVPNRMPQIARAVAPQPLPPPPAPSVPPALDRLRAALAAEAEVRVVGAPAAPTIRIGNRNGFASGSAALPPALARLLERIGAVLKDQPGAVEVISYTDDQPIRTVKYPSNFQLSAARAQAAREAIARTIGDPSRLTAEGRGEADPIASNATAEGREQNRRIEIVLQRQE